MGACARLWRLAASHAAQLWAEVSLVVASPQAAQAMAAWLRGRVGSVLSLRVSLPPALRGDEALSAAATALPAALAGGPLVRLEWRCGGVGKLQYLLPSFRQLEELTLEEGWQQEVSLPALGKLGALRRLALLSGAAKWDPIMGLSFGTSWGEGPRDRREYPGQPFSIRLDWLGLPGGLETLHLEGFGFSGEDEFPFTLRRGQRLRRLHIKAMGTEVYLQRAWAGCSCRLAVWWRGKGIFSSAC